MHEISLFNPAFTKAPSYKITVDDFITGIKLGKWKKEVESVRQEPDAELRKKLKQKVAGVTISGTFTERKEVNLIKHSGFIAIDIDGFTDRKALINDVYTYAIFSSISNSGLCVIVKIDSKKHKESFRWIQNHYFVSYGIVIDPAPSSPASLRFISYDIQCFINEKSQKAKSLVKKQANPQSLPIIIPKDQVGEMIKYAVLRRVNIAEDYPSYISLAYSIIEGFGEAGREYFHALASISSKYNSHHCDWQYNKCLVKSGSEKRATVGSFYWMLKNAGVPFPKNERYENAVRVAAIGKKANRNEEGVAIQLHEINGIPRDDASQIAKEVFGRTDISLSSIAQDPEKLIESLVAWMGMNHPMRKNILTGKIEENKNDLSRERMNSIFLRARAAFNTPNVSFDLIERIIFSDFCPEFNPLLEYIEKNRHRNTSGNIDRIIKCIKTPTKHSSVFIRKWLVSLIAAIHGSPVRLVLALVGKQLTGKSEWFRRLLPDKLKKYYGESKMDAGKDDELLMCSKLILMDDEMGGKTRVDEKRFKDLTSKNIFTLRAPYGRHNEDYKRLAVLCGTSNDREVINDPTGNTRILPVEINSMDYEGYNSIDKDELFMELVRVYESGEDWNFTLSELNGLTDISGQYEQIPYERELILQFFVPQEEAEGNGFIEEMTATEIKNYIELQTSKQQIRSLKRLGMELRNIFGERKVLKRGGKPIYVYLVVKLQKDQDVNQNGSAQTEKANTRYEKQEDFPF